MTRNTIRCWCERTEEWSNDVRRCTPIAVCDIRRKVFVLCLNGQSMYFGRGDQSVSQMSVLHLAVHVIVLEKFSSALMWKLLTTHSIVLFPLIPPVT
jgi:hypothetical protein